jgi:K+-transporting ATPase ATPase B chain
MTALEMDAPRVAFPATSRTRRRSAAGIGRIVTTAFGMFHPGRVVRNPVMFSVYVLFWFTLVLTILPGLFPDVSRPGSDPVYYLAITAILFLTLLFAFLAEAIAEAQGHAQAESLRQIRGSIEARRILEGGRKVWVPAESLRPGDVVEVRPSELIPLDGDVCQGAAQIDESMMTGESEPVVREAGGDRTSVLGGSRVLQGTVQVRITSEPGQSFLDRMIRLVEGTTREKTPNEIALTVLLAALTVALLVVILSFAYLADFLGAVGADVGTLIALLVCLMPTTIGGLLPAIGIAGVNRVSRANVVAKSGRAVEAAGDLDVLILDKTGTITVGNRLAVQFVPAPGITPEELGEAAFLCSSLDETPEGRSIVRLALRRGTPPQKIRPEEVRLVPFTPERRISGIVLPDGREIYKGAVSAIESYVGYVPPEVRRAAQEAARQGMTPLAVTSQKKVLGLVILRDVIKPGIRDRIRELHLMGIRTIMCTGDNRLTAAAIARESGVDEFIAEARPETKLGVISREKQYGHLVAMSGDGTNDAPALARADVGLAMNSGTSAAKEAGNMVDLDSDPTKLIEVVSIGKQLLITRGALTTFSITNDVAKYFAILPAVFVGIPGVEALNIMQLQSPHLAVLATLLFNALVIPLLIPLALRGVRFQPRTAVELLRRNMVIYGLGGLVSAFVGIKALYILLRYLSTDPQVMGLVVHLRTLLGGLGW